MTDDPDLMLCEGWQNPPEGYVPVGEYGSKFPLKKLASPWLVLDEAWRRRPDGELELSAVRLHDHRDDPAHEFLAPDAWHLWPNRRKLALWYNALHRRSLRLRWKRMTTFGREEREIMERESCARSALELQAMIIEKPDDWHVAGDLDWSPSGQVWRDGVRWVTVMP